MSRSIRKTRAHNSRTVWDARLVYHLGTVGVVGVGVGVAGGVAVSGNVLGVLGIVLGIVSSVLGIIVNRRQRRGGRAPARVKTVSAPTSLRWVRGMLPSNEGAAWLAEVHSCLAEAADPGERRRYMHSYRRAVPQLIWTSWSEHLSASGRRRLS